MVRFFRLAVLALCAVILLGFAFANRDLVTVSFDPFASSVVAGASATWLSQGRHRKASRQNRIEAEKLRAQAQALKSAHPALPSDR
jgi:hypothetical protein